MLKKFFCFKRGQEMGRGEKRRKGKKKKLMEEFVLRIYF